MIGVKSQNSPCQRKNFNYFFGGMARKFWDIFLKLMRTVNYIFLLKIIYFLVSAALVLPVISVVRQNVITAKS